MHVSAEFLPGHSHTDLLPEHISEYQIVDISRQSLCEPAVTKTGANIYQELCTFQDTAGHSVIREATIGIPNSNYTESIPNAVIATDPWTTGVRGLNRLKIHQLVDLGYPVVWLHHADHRSPLQRNKSITRSARHMHGLLDDISSTADFDTGNVIVDGYSRGGMTGEKFIALSKQHGRTAIFSILDAPCFAVDMSRSEKITTMIKQLPAELRGIGSVAIRHFKHSMQQGDLSEFIEFAKTPNLHLKDIAHETMWASALVNASVGKILEYCPPETRGIRNFFERDIMSQMSSYVDLYAPFVNIRVVAHEGPHVEGASPGYIYETRRAQFSVLGELILNNQILDAEVVAHRVKIERSGLSVVQ